MTSASVLWKPQKTIDGHLKALGYLNMSKSNREIVAKTIFHVELFNDFT